MPNEWKKANTSNADAWDFEKEKKCEGLYIRMEENIGPNSSNMYYFEDKGKEFAVWGTTILDRIFQGIQIGEEVKIEFLGVAKSPKTGRSFKNYEVYHRMPEVSVKEEGEKEFDGMKQKELDELFNKK